jgi:AraC-like DNA-binding protein
MCRLTPLPAEVGYAEPAAFRRIFKRATGISPLQYRQKFRRLITGL